MPPLPLWPLSYCRHITPPGSRPVEGVESVRQFFEGPLVAPMHVADLARSRLALSSPKARACPYMLAFATILYPNTEKSQCQLF